MNEDDAPTVWIGAFRYYCGRMSYAVGNFTTALIRAWPNLPEHARTIIARDLEEEFGRDEAKVQRLASELDKMNDYLQKCPPSAQKLLARAFSGECSPRQAIKAKCLDCFHFDRSEVAGCTVVLCPLHRFRPFQTKAK